MPKEEQRNVMYLFSNKKFGESMDMVVKLPMTNDDFACYASKYQAREWFANKRAFQACSNCLKITEDVIRILEINICPECLKLQNQEVFHND
jgi:hypothetical protein